MPEDQVRTHLSSKAFVHDPDLFWYWAALPSPGNEVNGYGFRRTRPMALTPAPGTIRTVTLGDSQVFGGGVRAQEAFSHVAEERLGPSWEVLNAGVSGYRSLHVYRLLRLKVLPHRPRYVVVDCMSHDSPREDGPLAPRPRRALSFEEALWNSRLYYLGQLGVRIAGWAPWETLPWPLQLPELRGRARSSPDPRDHGRLGNGDLIARWARAHGIEPLFMRYAYVQDGAIHCQDDGRSMPYGYAHFDTCGALRASGHPPMALFLDRNHLSPLGHGVVGEALAAKLREMRGEDAER
jgi:hypothetical protein